MLIAAFAGLCVAALVGATLAVLFLRNETGAAAPWPLAALHGLLGVGGLGCLVWALQGPPRGLQQGTASFGEIAAVLVGIAALVGLLVLFIHMRRRKRAGTLIGLHATLAISGVVILAAYLWA